MGQLLVHYGLPKDATIPYSWLTQTHQKITTHMLHEISPITQKPQLQTTIINCFIMMEKLNKNMLVVLVTLVVITIMSVLDLGCEISMDQPNSTNNHIIRMLRQMEKNRNIIIPLVQL